MAKRVGIHTIVILLIALTAFSAIFVLPNKTYAVEEYKTPDVIFYEIMWAGSSVSTSDEWIVLKNSTKKVIDITGWKIILSGSDTSIDLSGLIGKEGYYLISSHSKDHQFSKGQSILSVDPDIITSFSINNSKLQMRLVDGGNNEIDIAGDGSKPFAGSSKQNASMVRNEIIEYGKKITCWHTQEKDVRINIDSGVPDWASPQNSGKPIISSEWPESLATEISIPIKINLMVEGGNKKLSYAINGKRVGLIRQGKNDIALTCHKLGQQNINIKVTDETGLYSEINGELFCYQFADLIINEVYPAPQKDEKEWIEIYNPSDSKISLEKWHLFDKGGKDFIFTSNHTISPKSYLKVIPEGVSLNNTGDTLELLSPADELVSSVEWGKAKNGTSWARFDDNYKWTLSPTPDKENILSEEESEDEAVEEDTDNGSVTDTKSDSENRGDTNGQKIITTKKVIGGEKVLALALNNAKLPKIGESTGLSENSSLPSPPPLENSILMEATFGSIGILTLARMILSMISLWL